MSIVNIFLFLKQLELGGLGSRFQNAVNTYRKEYAAVEDAP